MIEPFRNAEPEQVVAGLRALHAYKQTTFDIDELDRATASDLGNVLTTVHETFAGKLILTGVVMQTLDRKDIARTHRNRLGQVFIRLNRERFRDRRNLQSRLQEAFNQNRIAGPDIIHVLWHESAHVLQASQAVGLHRVKAYVQRYPPSARELSMRATKNVDEGLAEALAKVVRTPQATMSPWLGGFREALNHDIRAAGGIIHQDIP